MIHNQSFNVGRTSENYQIREVALMVRDAVPGSTVQFAAGAGADARNYRVDCSKLEKTLRDYQPRWTVEAGIYELADAYRQYGLQMERFCGPAFLRLQQIKRLQQLGRVDSMLRWSRGAACAASAEKAPYDAITACNETNTAMVFTNQLRQKIGVMFGNPETTSGGMALKFYS